MQKIYKKDYFELAVFLMDYHSGQSSRGYRLLCKLKPNNFSSSLCDECRDSEIYAFLECYYSNKV